jgi:hypothetical protein
MQFRIAENNASGVTYLRVSEAVRNVLICDKLVVSLAGGTRSNTCTSPCEVSGIGKLRQ